MNKITTLSFGAIFFATSLFATQNMESNNQHYERIAKFYESKLKESGINVSVNFKERLEVELPFETILLEFINDDIKTLEPVFLQGDYFFSDTIAINSFESSKEKAQNAIKKMQDKEILKTLKYKKLITLGSGNNEVFVFSDPNCPYCKAHLKTLTKDYLKEHKVYFIPIGLLSDDSLKKVVAIEKELKRKRLSDSKILDILNTYYDSSKISQEPSINEFKEAKDVLDNYRSLGVNFVPYVINND